MDLPQVSMALIFLSFIFLVSSYSTSVYDSSTVCKEPVIPSLDELQAKFSKEGDLMDYRGAEEAGYNFGPSFRPLQLQWKAEGNDKEMLFSYSLKENLAQFFVHPCLIDALFQATAIMEVPPYEINSTTSVFLRTINVLVFVEKFTWWGHPCTNEGFVYISQKGSHLLDSNGRLLATAQGIEYAATTLGNILALIDSQKNPFPPMYDHIWRDELGPNARRIKQQFLASQQPIIYKKGEYEDSNFYEKSAQLCRFYMMKALKELEIDSVFNNQQNIIRWPEISETLGVLSNQSKLLRYVLMEMATAGYFKMLDATTFKMSFQLVRNLPSLQSISVEIEKISNCFNSDIALGNVDFKCIAKMGPLLSDILTGKKDATYGEISEIYYTQSHFMNTAMEGVATNWIPFIKDLIGSNSNCVLRILEVGAGDGALVKEVVKHLDPSQRSQLEYTYTDISTEALDKGRELLQNIGIRAKYEIFNIEENPIKQGFIWGNYDIIVANYAIHWAKDIQKSIQNLQQLLCPYGTLLIVEGIEPNPVKSMLLGCLPKFWDFEDKELRPYHSEICIQNWKTVLQDCCGFIDFSYIKICNSMAALISTKRPEQLNPSVSQQSFGTWIVFGDLEANTLQVLKQLQHISYKYLLLTKSDGISETEITNNLQQAFNQKNQIVGLIYLWGISSEFITPHAIAEPYLYICKYIINFQPSIKLLVMSKGALSIGSSDQSVADPNASPLIGMTTVLQNECSTLSAKCVDIDSSANVEAAIYEALSTLVQLDNEIVSVFRGGRKYVPRLAHHRVKNTSLPIPQGGQKYRLALPPSNLISDLCFESCSEQAATLEQGEYEIEVKAYALNFKDVFVVLKPIAYFEQFNTLGYDFAGIVTRVGPSKNYPRFKVGDHVNGARKNGDSMASHIVVNEDRLFPLPTGLTFCDGATLPIVITTVTTALLDVAKLEESDVLLIHTASGGVGLGAIQIAQTKKCTIVATAGNERKRRYLKSLGLKHVFNSRTTDFATEIPKALGGRGVNVVLNSLTGPGFKEATLSICQPSARWIEISKLNIWSKEEIEQLRPDIRYSTVDLNEMSDKELHETIQRCLFYFARQMKEVKPLPYAQFELGEIRTALEYLQQAKQMGKVVIKMPNFTTGKTDLFNPQSSYLITGGLGGIGLEVLNWMASSGGRHFIIASREPRNNSKIEALRSKEIRIVMKSCDVGDHQQCETLFREIARDKSNPPIRGVMHLAGLIADATLENQKWDLFKTVFGPKVDGGWNLHHQSLQLRFPLEHFVTFSSATVQVGSPGQANYVAGNQYLDSLVHYRNSIGLVGTTINWGQWAQVGMGANLTLAGIKPFAVLQGITALEHIIKSNVNQVVVIDGDLQQIQNFIPAAVSLFSELTNEGSSGHATLEVDSGAFWAEYEAQESHDDKLTLVSKIISNIVRSVLRLEQSEVVDEHASFTDLGMDSLLLVELKNNMQSIMGKRLKLTVNSVKDYKTIATLSSRLVQLISGDEEFRPPTREEFIKLVKNDSILPQNITVDSSKIETKMAPISATSYMLLTGVTGNLGPYILREILNRRQTKLVYCIIRTDKSISAKERLEKILQEKGLSSEIDMGRVVCLSGDVTKPQFGIDDEIYKRLCSEVEAVFNLAVKAGWEEIYRDSDNTSSARIVNLNSVRNTLEFAVTKKLKYVYHSSTMASESTLADGCYREDWPNEGEFDRLPYNGYAVSKYVGDLLIKEACVCRGIPCKMFRFSNIGGDTEREGGNIEILKDFLMQRLLVYLKLRIMPAFILPVSLFPVNLAANISIKIFFNDATANEVYNMVNPQLANEREFEEIAQDVFGVAIEVLEPDDFMEKVKSSGEDGDVKNLLVLLLEWEQEVNKLIDEPLKVTTGWLFRKEDFFLSKKLASLIPSEYPGSLPSSWKLIVDDLKYAKKVGIFEKLGIKCNENDGENVNVH